MRRLLVVMIQPPGCSGVQALIYNKLLPFYERHGWEIHFAGPAPWLTSVLTEQLDYPAERLHYTSNVSSSVCFSVRKNRQRKGSLAYVAYGVLQLLARLLEQLRRHDSDSHLLKGLAQSVREAEQRCTFDLIAGKSPDFKVLALAHDLSQEMGKPLLALIDDPYGARDEQGFYPKSPELQQKILRDSRATFFMSSLTRERYVEAGLLARNKAHVISDSYPVIAELYVQGRSPLAGRSRRMAPTESLQLIYLGMLPEWRPIEPFLEAFQAFAQPQHSLHPRGQLAIYGFVYASARRRIASDPRLAERIQLHPLVSYAASHALAEDADVQLVVIGPRHLDNVPSKFFEYLAHHKPMLILGPPQNPLRDILNELKIGLYVDGRHAEAIVDALESLQTHYSTYQQAYTDQAAALEAFSAPRVAERFCHLLDQALTGRENSSQGVVI